MGTSLPTEEKVRVSGQNAIDNEQISLGLIFLLILPKAHTICTVQQKRRATSRAARAEAVVAPCHRGLVAQCHRGLVARVTRFGGRATGFGGPCHQVRWPLSSCAPAGGAECPAPRPPLPGDSLQ